MSQPENSLPDGLLVAWYADDFTGGAAVMEVLTFAGLPSMLFLDHPTPSQLARYPGLKGIGVASTARAQSPEWMDTELPEVFEKLADLTPQIMHYKVCSTLDSSPRIGSIGRAIEIGAARLAPAAVPVLIAAPQMRRYQAFGNLFAGFGDRVFRLDQHPVLARHPTTPMCEADVAKHLSHQSDKLDAQCLMLEDIATGTVLPASPPKRDRITVVTLDCVDAVSEETVGGLIWKGRSANSFVVGSQGVEYALVRHWQASGQIKTAPPPKGVGVADNMIVVSGSVSQTTADQIGWALADGFVEVAFDAARACAGADALDAEISRCVDICLVAIARGGSPLVHTALGPDDPAVSRFNEATTRCGLSQSEANTRVGAALGQILYQALSQSGVRRAVVSGGDTSGHATRQLGIFALSALASTIPGAALCRAHAEGPMDGLELALKGGQMGSQDYFGWIRSGGGAR